MSSSVQYPMATAGSASGRTVWVLATNPPQLPPAHCRWLACQLCDGASGYCTVDVRWCTGTDSPPVPELATAGSPSAPRGKPSPRSSMPR